MRRLARKTTQTLAGTPRVLRLGDWTLVEPLNALGALAVDGRSEDAR